MKKYISFLILWVAFVQAAWPAEKKLVYILNIKQEITKATWRQTSQAFAEADSLKADAILIHMNTYGGTVLDADSIRTKILESKIPVYVFIDNNAASAGALISIACDSIYMRPGSSIGAATVVNQTGAAMPDKYQSYMRSTMRSTAEAHGRDTLISGNDTLYKWRRDPKIAEAMVDPSVYIEGVVDTGKVLTFTPSEAMKHGYCDGIAQNIPEVVAMTGIKNYDVAEYKPTWIEKIIGWLVHPIISGLLIMAIIGGIYFEMQSPGIGFALLVAIIAALLYFAPLYLEGLAENWEILIFVAGLILLAVEIFILPGFGVAGIAGAILVFAGLILSLVDNFKFNFDHVSTFKISIAFITVVLGMFFGLILSLWLGSKLFNSTKGLFGHLALKAVQDTKDGYISVETSLFSLQGMQGTAHTMLRPGGKVLIGADIYDAIAENGYIEKGEKVKVTRIETMQVYVEKV